MKISSYIKNASWFATLGAVMLLSAQMGEARAQGICDRTDEVEAAIIAAIPGNPACGAVTATQLADVNPVGGLTIDSLDSAGETLQVGDFAGLSGLTTLNLSGNSNLGTVALPAELFNGLSALTTLNLSGNLFLGTTALPAGLFNGLSALTTLNLSGNLFLGTTALPAGLFNDLNALTTLNLSNNSNLQSNGFSNGIFDDVLDTLTELRLDDRLAVTLAFSAATPPANIPPNGNLNLVVALNQTLPFAVRVPYDATFSGGADSSHFTGESGMLDFATGSADDQTITITAANAPLNSTITIALGTPVPGTIADNTFTAITHATGAGGAIPAAVLREFILVTSNNNRILTVGTPVAATPAPICTRTDDVARAILAAIGGGVTCETVTAEQLATVDPGNGLTIDSLDSDGDTLRVGDFAGLSGLRRLNLAGNARLGSTTLSTGLFNDLSELTTLDLSGNSSLGSVALPAELFNDLSTLTTLNLSGNRLLGNPALPAELFNGLSALTILDLSGNSSLGFPALPAGLFNDLSALTTLDLSDNSTLGLLALPAGLFNSLSALTTLDLSGNRLLGNPALPAGLFNDLSALTTLNLSDNFNLGNVALPVELFNDLSALTTLDLSDNSNLGNLALPAGLFNGLSALTTLDLSGNLNLTSLPDGLLDDILDTLTGLQLDTGLRRTLSLSVNRNSLVKGGAVIFQFNVVTALEAGLGVRVPYTAAFVGGGTADHFTGLSASGTMDIVPGMASTTLEVTALDDAPIGATATITLDVPSLLYDGDNDGSSDEVKSGNPLNLTDPVFNLVRVDTGNDEQTITIREDAIRLRIRTFLEGALQ